MNVQWSVIPGSRAYGAIGATNFLTVGLDLAALLFIIILVWRIYIRNAKKFSNFFNFNLIIFLFVITAWTFISFMQVGVHDTLYRSSNPLVYLTVLAIIIGFDSNMWAKLSKISFLLAVLNISLAYFYYFNLTMIYSGALLGNSPVMTYFVAGFWLTAVSLVGYEDKSRKKSALIYTQIVLLLILSIIVNSRGWMFQSIILMLLAAFHIGRTKGIIRFIKAFLTITLIGLVAYYILDNYYLDYLITLIDKFGKDTRSFQYIEVFSQIPAYQFIIGGGIDAKYHSSLYGEYSYIDNQYIFILFHYGILMLLPYIYFYLYSILSVWKAKFVINKSGMFIVIMWLLALGGLSVYNWVIIDIKNFILPIVAGRCLYISMRVNNKELD